MVSVSQGMNFRVLYLKIFSVFLCITGIWAQIFPFVMSWALKDAWQHSWDDPRHAQSLTLKHLQIVPRISQRSKIAPTRRQMTRHAETLPLCLGLLLPCLKIKFPQSTFKNEYLMSSFKDFLISVLCWQLYRHYGFNMLLV